MQIALYIILIIAFFALVASIYYYIKAKKYTRERFAFAALASAGSLLLLELLNLFSSNESILGISINLANSIFRMEIEHTKGDWVGQVLSVIILSAYLIFIFFLYRQWDGGISVREENLLEQGDRPTLLNDAVFFLYHMITNDKNLLQISNKNDNKSDVFASVRIKQIDKEPWHQEVKDYYILISSHYKIQDSDWHEEYSLYDTKYDTQNILIYCSINEKNINLNSIETYLKMVKKKFLKIIVCLHDISDIKINTIMNIQIQVKTKDDLLNEMINFDNYSAYLHNKFYNSIINCTHYTYANTYTSISGKIFGQDNTIESIEEYIYLWLGDATHKQLALLGDYGQGKSVLCLKIANYIFENQSKFKYIPIIVDLNGKSPRNLSSLDLISQWSATYALQPHAIIRLIHEGKILLIFDGFDEMDMVGDKNLRLEHFKKLWQFANQKSKIIITGRPNFFLDTDEIYPALNTLNKDIMQPYAEVIYLSMLTKKQVEESLKNEPEILRREILELFEKLENQAFIDLIIRPSILFLVRQLWNEIKLESNLTASRIIETFIRHTYKRQLDKEIKSHILTLEEIDYFMQGIALHMLTVSGTTNSIDKSTLLNIIKILYHQLDQKIQLTENILPLSQRLPSNMAIETLSNFIITTGLMVHNLERSGYFKFSHKSYFEYFIGNYFAVKAINSELKLKYKIFSRVFQNKIRFSWQSKEIITFAAEEVISMQKINSFPSVENTLKLFPDIMIWRIKSIELISYLSFMPPLKMYSNFAIILNPDIIIWIKVCEILKIDVCPILGSRAYNAYREFRLNLQDNLSNRPAIWLDNIF